MRAHTASLTARAVAVGRAVGVGDVRDDVVARLLPRRDQLLVATLRAAPSPPGPLVGATAHAALRMHAVDAAIAEAVRVVRPSCVVVVGAGYDTRAWRLPALAGTRVVEVDHPATQDAKRAGLGSLAPVAADVQLVGADLTTDDLGEVLTGVGQDPDEPVVWVWEAVAYYLPPAAVDTTLEVMAARSPEGSRLLLTTMAPGLLDPPLGGLSLPALLGFRAMGEPILCAETDDAVATRLARTGWVDSGGRGPRAWAAAAGAELVGPVLDEHLHVATRQG